MSVYSQPLLARPRGRAPSPLPTRPGLPAILARTGPAPFLPLIEPATMQGALKSKFLLVLLGTVLAESALAEVPKYDFTTLAGAPASRGFADGMGGSARFNAPRGIAVDDAGNIYVADTLNNTIRKGMPASPIITGQPQSQAVLPGTNVTLSVAASGTAPLRYQWRFNGVNLAGATDSSLPINNVQAVNVGAYDAVVSNSFGGVQSTAAILTLGVVRFISSTGIGTNA